MSGIEKFDFGGREVRIVLIDGEPWFVLADLCAVLGISDVSIVRRRLDDALCQTHPIEDRLGRAQQATIVSEPGMYEVVIRSDKPEAANFRRWITGEVLPTIRKTGSYGAPAAPALTGAELVAAALVESQKILEARDTRILQLEAQQVEDAPAVLYVAEFVTDADLLTFSTVASTCGVTEKALRELLIERDWIYVQTDSRWSNTKGCKVTRNRYSEKATKKRHFQRVLNHEAPRFRGSEVMHTLKITPFGAQAIARLVQERAA